MANQTDGTNRSNVIDGLEPGQYVERAHIAPDGTIQVPCCVADLKSVDVADVDLLLSFTDGRFVIIPNGALDATSETARPVVFVEDSYSSTNPEHTEIEHRSSLGDLFKMVGITKHADAGSLRVVSENVDVVGKTDQEEDSEVESQDDGRPDYVPKITSPQSMVNVSDDAKTDGKGPGLGTIEANDRIDITEEEVPPTTTPRPTVYKAPPKLIDISDPTVTLDDIAGDGWVNLAESTGDIAITGVVGGGAQAGDIVTLTIDADTVDAIEHLATVLDDGTFSLDIPSSDLINANNLVVNAMITTVGAENPGTDAKNYFVDVDPPAPPIATLNVDSGVDSTDSITNNAGFTLGNIEPGAGTIVEYSIDSTDGSDGSWSTAVPTAAEGANSFYVRQVDTAGNESSGTQFSFTLDTLAPVAPSVALDTDSGISAVDAVTNVGTFIVGGTEPGATVEYSVDSTDGVDGSWSTAAPAVAEGANSFYVRQVDVAGNESPGNQLSFTLDTAALAPTVSLDIDSGASSSDAITNVGTFTVSGTEPGATVEYSLDSTDGSDGSWSTTSPPVNEGANSFFVRQVDIAGNTSDGTQLSFTLDTMSPSAPTVTLDADSGVSAIDAITNIGTFTVGGTEAGATVEFSLDSTDGIDGSWSTTAPPVTEGANSFYVRQVDIAGNESTGTQLSFTLDTVAAAPTVTLDTDSGVSAIDAVTNVGAFTVGGTEVGATVEYSVDSTDGLDGSWSTAAPAVVEGANSFYVRQVDVAGNESPGTPLSFTLDTVAAAPTVTLDTDSGVSAIDAVTNVGAFTVGGTEVGATVEYSVDSTDGLDGSWSAAAPAVVEGANSFYVRQVDVAGNESPGTQLSFTLDTAAPVAPTVSLDIDSGASLSDAITNVGTFTVGGTEPGATVEYSTDSTDGVDGSWSTAAPAVVEGANSFYVRQVDVAGNESPGIPLSFTLDTVDPVPTIALDPDITGDGIIDLVESTGNVTITGIVGGDAQVNDTVTLTLDNGTATTTYTGQVFLDIDGITKIFSIDVPGVTLVDDLDTTVEASITSVDEAGNTGTAVDPDGESFTVNLSAPVPEITIDPNITGDGVVNIAEAAGNVTITGTVAGDALVGDTVTLTLVDGNLTADYTGQVTLDVDGITKIFSIDVAGSTLAGDDDTTIEASISTTIGGKTGTAIDPDGESYAVDLVAPAVTGVSASSALVVDADDSGMLTLTVTFSEAMNTGIDPALALPAAATGSLVFDAGSSFWSDASTYVASYTIADDNVDLADIDIDISGAEDVNGNVMLLHTDPDVLSVDTLNPTVLSLTPDNADGVVSDADATVTYTVTFSEAVPSLVDADISVTGGSLVLGSQVQNSATEWTFQVVATDDSTTDLVVAIGSTVADANGNALVPDANSTDTLPVDTVNPAVVSLTTDNVDGVVSDADATVTYTVTFSEAVPSLVDADISVTGGSLVLGSQVQNSATEWTFQVVATDDSTTDLVVAIGSTVADANGNALVPDANSTNTLTVDTENPAVTGVSASSALVVDADDSGTLTLTVTFSEAMNTGIDPALALPAAATGSLVFDAGSSFWSDASTYVASYTIADDNVDLADIDIDISGAEDVNGNVMLLHTDPDVLSVDTLNPTVTTVDASPVVISDTDAGIGTFSITVTFSEAMDTSVDPALVFGTNVSGTLAINAGLSSWTDSSTYVATYDVSDADVDVADVTVDVSGAQDVNGNAQQGYTEEIEFSIDMAPPAAPVLTGISSDTGIPGDFITSDPTLIFDGTAEAGSTVEVFIDGASIGTTTASGAGVWSFDYTTIPLAEGDYDVSAQATDVNGNTGALSAAQTVTIENVTDTTPPSATIAVDDTALAIGESSLVTITFNEAVFGFTNADLIVENGTLSPVSTADGGTTWTAILTPDVPNESTGNVITLKDASVFDLAGNNNSGADVSNSYDVDTIAPNPTISLDQDITADDVINIAESNGTVAITGTVAGDAQVGDTVTLTLVNANFTGVFTGAVTLHADLVTKIFSVDVSGSALVADANTEIEASIETIDAAGNIGTGSDSASYSVDVIAPVPTIALDPNISGDGIISIDESAGTVAVTGTVDGDAKVGDTVTITVNNTTFSDVVTLDIDGITKIFSVNVDGSALAADTEVEASVTTYDTAGNPGSETDTASYIVDTDRPSATSIIVHDGVLTIGETSQVTVIFNEAVSGLVEGDFVVGNGSLSGLTTSDGVTWTATFTPDEPVEDTSNVISLDNALVNDVAGNTGVGTTSSNNFQIDTKRPTANIAMDDYTLIDGEQATVTITFSEEVTNFINADLVFTGGTLTNVSSLDGITWTAVFTPAANTEDTDNIISLDNTGVNDLAGNIGQGVTDSLNYWVDTVAPTATLSHDNADGVVSDADNIVNFTVTFSEAVGAFAAADLTIAGGSLTGGPTLAGDGESATFSVTADNNSTTALSVTVNGTFADLAGNAGTGDNVTLTVDTVNPVVTSFTGDNADGVVSDADNVVTYSVTFSEEVAAFTAADLTIVGGSLTSGPVLAGGGMSATFEVTAADDSTADLSVTVNNTVLDLNGNTLPPANVTLTVDTENPTINSISMSDYSLGINETSTVTIEFSEEVAGFDGSDVSAPNGTLGAFTTSDNVTWTATFTPSDNTEAPVNVVTVGPGFTDLAGNAGAGGVSTNYAVNTTNPDFECSLFTSPEFKVTGGSGTPVGSDDSSPAAQATREVINGTNGNDTISHNSSFSSGQSQWAKVLNITFSDFTVLTAIEIVIAQSVVDAIAGFDIAGTGVSAKVLDGTDYKWTLSPDAAASADMIANGLNLDIVYDVDNSSAPLDFNADVNVSGTANSLPFDISNTLDLSWREASSTSDFEYPNALTPAMILPRDGLGVEINAGDGDDNVSAGAGHDIIYGGLGNDTLDGGTGDDIIDGGDGGDTIIGGLGNDTATYDQTTAGVVATLDTGIGVVNTDEAAGDTYNSIENLVGGSGNDTLIGDSNVNVLTGGDGDDILEGREGADILSGGSGSNTASYAHAAATDGGSQGLVASLSSTGANTGDATGDTYNSIQNLTGSDYDDTLEGNSGVNILTGGSGDDILEGRAGGDDIHGGAGIDTASYASSTATVRASLLSLSGNIGDAAGDRFTSIENLTGGSGSDVLIGDAGVNVLSGGAGNDILEGRQGGDTLDGGAGNDTLKGGDGGDFLIGGAGSDYASYSDAGSGVVASLDTLYGINTGYAAGDTYSGIENIYGSVGNDILIGDGNANILDGNIGNDILEGQGGADTLNGSLGIDTVRYLNAATGVTASLASPGVNTGDAAGDTYSSVENLTGSTFNDNLSGDSLVNVLAGDAGDDILEGRASADHIDGGAGIDAVSYANASVGVKMDLGASGNYIEVGDSVSGPHDAVSVSGGIVTAVDTYFDVENIIGSNWDDTLAGNSLANEIEGGAGDDTIDGALNTDGFDIASYAGASGGVNVDLTISGAQDTLSAGRDILLNLEGLRGSDHNDTLTGDNADNWLDGGAGNDTINGGLGSDEIYANQGFDTVDAGDNNDTVYVSATSAPNLVDGGSIDGGADDGGTGDSMVLQDLGGSYDLTALAEVTTNIETLDIRGDGTNTTLTITSQDIQDMVNDGAFSELTIIADSGDSLVVALDAGETLSSPFVAGVDDTYTIDNGGTVATIHWDVA